MDISLIMKNILLTLLIFTSFNCSAQLIKKDKQLHFGAGAFSAFVGYHLAEEIYYYKPVNIRKRNALIYGIGASLIAGTLKEFYDYKSYGKFDFADLGYTVAGGVAVSVTLNIFKK